MNSNQYFKGTRLADFYPEGWDIEKIDKCCSFGPANVQERQVFWNNDFKPVSCESQDEFNMMMGHEIAQEIRKSRDNEEKLILILPVGPMGMYKWVIYFLKEWDVSANHVYGFNMDEWCDKDGNAVDSSHPDSFQSAMEDNFYGPLGDRTIPRSQRFFAQKDVLPTYAEKIEELRGQGARLVVIYGIGRACHIAFWEPTMAEEYPTEEEWRSQTHRIAMELHPLSIEQNAITSFKSRFSLIPGFFGNTIGPGIFLKADRAIGGCDGVFSNGMQWQGMSFWLTLRYGPNMWVPSSYMPTVPGKLFYVNGVAGPLVADVN